MNLGREFFDANLLETRMLLEIQFDHSEMEALTRQMQEITEQGRQMQRPGQAFNLGAPGFKLLWTMVRADRDGKAVRQPPVAHQILPDLHVIEPQHVVFDLMHGAPAALGFLEYHAELLGHALAQAQGADIVQQAEEKGFFGQIGQYLAHDKAIGDGGDK